MMEKYDYKSIILYWNNFLNCENEEFKETWLDLFMYEYQDAISKMNHNFNINDIRSLSNVSSQLSCYLLKLIYSTIATSLTNTVCNSDVDCVEDANNVNLNQPGDINHVVALRNFFLYGIGGRILKTLYLLGIKNISCGKELCRVLINIFPTAPWDSPDVEVLESPIDFEHLVNSLKLLTICTSPKEILQIPNILSVDENLLYIQNSNLLADINNKTLINSPLLNDVNYESPVEYQTEKFKEYMKQNISCDYFSYILLHLLSQLITEENLEVLDENSITFFTLQFLLNCLQLLQTEREIFNKYNCEIIRTNCVVQIYLCLNNIFQTKKFKIDELNIGTIFDKLLLHVSRELEIIQNNDNDKSLMDFKLNYIFLLFYAIVVIVKNTFIQNVKSGCKVTNENSFNDIYIKFYNSRDIILQVYKLLSVNTGNRWKLKIQIDIILMVMIDLRFTTEGKSNRRNKHRIKINSKYHNSVLDGPCKNTTCMWERIIIGMLSAIEPDHQKMLLKALQHNSQICCCNLNSKTLTIIEKLFYENLQLQQLCLNFIHFVVIKPIYTSSDCDNCDLKRSSIDFEDNFIRLYKDFQDLTSRSQQISLSILLKHFIKISKILSYNMSYRILADIILPIFRKEKLRQTTEGGSRDIIILCLIIFSSYLRDIRIIKSFFNDENIEHLKDLSQIPETVKYVCCLIKLGVQNLNFIGENSVEQEDLSEKLILLLINNVNCCTESICRYFHEVMSANKFILLKLCQHQHKESYVPSDFLQLRKQSVRNLFQIYQIHWNTILQLIRLNSQQFRSEFIDNFCKKYNDEENILFILVYNLLSCILYTKNIETIRNKYINYRTTNKLFKNCDTNITLNINCDNRKHNLNSFNYDIDYNSLINLYECLNSEINIKISELLLNNGHDGNNNTINIYNVNLIKKYKFKFIEDEDYALPNCASNAADSIHQTIAEHQQSNATDSPSFLNGVTAKINKFLIKNTLFGLFFQPSNNHEILEKEDETVRIINKEDLIYTTEELNLIRSEKFSKKLLIIFESILSTWLMLASDIETDKNTQTAMEELKKLLITHAIEYWDSFENGTAILSALQSLLKVAETKNVCCISSITSTARSEHSHYNDAANDVSASNPTSNSKDSDGEFVTPLQSFENDNFGSDFEHSEGDTTEESYLTADDGYDADGEIQTFQESDNDVPSYLKTSFIPSSNYRSLIVHENVSRIVIEILMNLSERCKENVDFWPNLLTQVVTRLIVIREALGGSNFIIKGFSPILESNDESLRDFQKSILELVTDLNTPEAVTSFLSILSSKNPPVDLLLPRLLHLSNATIKNQPYVNVQFPIANDASITKSCDSMSMQRILEIHDYHLHHELSTSFTQSAQIAPLSFVDFKPWQSNGFTVTTWVQISNSNTLFPNNSGHKKNETNTPVSSNPRKKSNTAENCQCFNDKTHLLSVGTEKLLLTFSLDVNNSLCLNLIKPNVVIQGKKVMKTSVVPTNENIRKYNRRMMRNNRQVKIIDLERNSSSTPEDSADENESVSNKENIINISDKKINYTLLNKTKNMLKKSLSNIHLLPSKDEHFYNDIDLIKHPIVMKDLKLQRNKWTLLSFSVKASDKAILITITVDGTETYDIDIPCSKTTINSANKNSKIPLLCIGANQMNILDQANGNQSTSSMHENIQNKLKYSISNIMLFRHFINNPIVLANLYAFGPECVNFVKYETNNLLPNFGSLNIKNLPGVCDLQSNESMKMLTRHLIIVYSAHTPRFLIGYRKNKNELDVNTTGEPIGILTFGEMPKTMHVISFQTAIYLAGGLSTLLFLFARIVELTDSAYLQSAALNLLLRFAHSNNEYYSEFIYKNYINLIGVVIKTKKCHKNVLMLKSILDVACDGPVLIKSQRTDKYQVLTNTNACIIYPELVISILKNYSVWSSRYELESNVVESEVLDILFGVLLALVREKHPQQQLNSHRLTSCNLLNFLISFCKIHLIVVSNPVHISKSAADSLFSLVGILAGAPPRPILLDEIMKLLLLMHRPSDSFVTHDRAKFYNILSCQGKSKANGSIKQKLVLKLNTQRIAQSVRIRDRRSTMDKSLAATKKLPKMQRSISLDSSMPSTSAADAKDDKNENKKEYIEEALKEINTITNWIYESNENTDDIWIKRPPPTKPKVKKSVDKTSLKPSNILDSQETLKVNEAFSNLHVKRQLLQNKKRVRRLSKRQKKLNYKTSESEGTTSGTVSESGIEQDMIPTHEYDIINSEELSERTITEQSTVIEKSKHTGHSKSGSVYVQEGFFTLLRDFILILPDNYAEEVLNHYVTIEILLVLSSHHNCGVRASIIRLIAVLMERLPVNTLNLYTKQNYWYHLGNQISLNTVDINILKSCIYWVTGTNVNFEIVQQNLFKFNDDIVVRQKYGLNALIAILPQTVHTPDITNIAIHFIHHIYNKFSDAAQYMLENGLSALVIKTFVTIFSRFKVPNEIIITSLTNLAITIAFKSLTSIGSINILWDLLNGFSFLETTKNEGILRGIRVVHANILIHLLTTCIDNSQTPVSSSGIKSKSFTIQLNDCPLPAAEIKTRFDMIYDRAIQFITNTNSAYVPTDIEQVLIEYLIILFVNGQTSGSNIIVWTLIPSRSLKLKVFATKKLWEFTKNGNISLIRCDPKILRILSQSFLLINRDLIPPNDLEDVTKFCHSVSGGSDSPPNPGFGLSQALEKIEAAREQSLKDQRPGIERTIYKYEGLVEQCIESAMKITRDVVELQNNERRILMNDMRVDDDFEYINEWKHIIKRMTHENSAWYNSNLYPTSWRLDDTEGPDRVKRRLQRTFLKVDPKFMLSEFREKLEVNEQTQLLSYISNIKGNSSFIVNDQVLYTFTAKFLPVDNDIDGELIITETQLVFVPNNYEECAFEPIICDIVKILEIWPRRYQHQNIGLELFLHSAKSMFIILNSEEDKETIQKFLSDKIVHGFDKHKLDVSTQQWREGQLTNWEYLIILNQLSGRTYNDLMQYPIFPWILSDYDSVVLNLTNFECFRKLDRPIAIQHKEMEMHYINNYNYLSQAFTESGMKPYHYGSHYSNSGTILHFMVRMPPFTSLFLHYQDNNFDIPDRTFHSLKTTWRLASKESPTDVKELIPEFFCLPELLENTEGFNFGLKQSGEAVNHVSLPVWCDDSARLFILIHRQALESEIVRTNLNSWIDLIFGYKQTGKHAVEAVNVFHPATYYGFTSSNITDPVEKLAYETMVRTYGQMPRQIFDSPHSSSNTTVAPKGSNLLQPILQTVRGLRWGIYTGSPELPNPVLINIHPRYDIKYAKLISLNPTNVVYGIPNKCNIMQGADMDTLNIILWGETDDVVRVKSISANEDNMSSKSLFHSSRIDPISACGSDPSSSNLWFGHKSGRITIYQCSSISTNLKYSKNRLFNYNTTKLTSYNSAFRKFTTMSKSVTITHDLEYLIGIKSAGDSTDLNNLKWSYPIVLIKHTDEINDIKISMEFKIVVSISKDGYAAIWDSNSFEYIRSIEPPSNTFNSEIKLVTISPTLGDIVTIHSIENNLNVSDENVDDEQDVAESIEVTENNIDDFVRVSINLHGKSQLRLHTINAQYVKHIIMQENVTAVCYTRIKEGTGVNAIVVGLENGLVRFYSSWNLDVIREIVIGRVEVTSITFTTYQHMIILTKSEKEDVIQVWESPGLVGTPPKFPQIVFRRGRSI